MPKKKCVPKLNVNAFNVLGLGSLTFVVVVNITSSSSLTIKLLDFCNVK